MYLIKNAEVYAPERHLMMGLWGILRGEVCLLRTKENFLQKNLIQEKTQMHMICF